jgi:hypothetical protein
MPEYRVLVYPYKFEVTPPYEKDAKIREICEKLTLTYIGVEGKAWERFKADPLMKGWFEEVKRLPAPERAKAPNFGDVFFDRLRSAIEEEKGCYAFFRLEAANEKEAEDRAIALAHKMIGEKVLPKEVPWGAIQFSYKAVVLPAIKEYIIDPPEEGPKTLRGLEGVILLAGLFVAIPALWAALTFWPRG